MDYILIFTNTHNALYCEKILNGVKINISVLPTPSYISNSCGISIGINDNNLNEVKNLIFDNKINVKFIYDVKNKSVLKQ